MPSSIKSFASMLHSGVCELNLSFLPIVSIGTLLTRCKRLSLSISMFVGRKKSDNLTKLSDHDVWHPRDNEIENWEMSFNIGLLS